MSSICETREEIDRKNYGLVSRTMPFSHSENKGTIEKIISNQYIARIYLKGSEGALMDARSAFTIPSEDLPYLQEILRLQSRKQLIGANINILYVLGDKIYGIKIPEQKKE